MKPTDSKPPCAAWRLRRGWLLAVGLGVAWCLASPGKADTLFFIAQTDINGVVNHSWFSADNWFKLDPQGNYVHVGRLPQADETAILTGTVEGTASGIHVQSLVASANALIKNGDFLVDSMTMLGGSTFNGSTITVQSSLGVGGPNCGFINVVLILQAGAAATLSPVAPATSASLNLSGGSFIYNLGQIVLTDSCQLSGGGLPQSEVDILPGAVLSSSGQAVLRGAASGHLIVNNNGTIRADSGTLRIDQVIDWQCTNRLGKFNAATPAAGILFAAPFSLDAGVTNLFTGPGTNRLTGGASINGALLIGGRDPGTGLFDPGNLELSSSLTGTGRVQVLGGTAGGSALNWINATLAVPRVDIESGASLRIGGGGGTSRLLSAGTLNNSGQCILLGNGFAFDQGATFNNLAGGLFEMGMDGTFGGGPPPAGGSFNNAGTFRKATGGTTQFGVTSPPTGPDFNNTGLVDLQAGQLNLFGGVSAGEFRSATGAVLWFWGGTHVLNDGARFTGGGSVRLSRGALAATWLVNGSVSVNSLELGTSGTLDGPGALMVGSAFLWSDGAILGSGGTLVLSNSATCQISGSASKTLLQRQIDNYGSIVWLGTGAVTAGSGAVLNNQAGAALDLRTNIALLFNNITPALALNNFGALLKSAGTAASTLAATLTNRGLLRLSAGTLNLQGSYQQAATGTLSLDLGGVVPGTTYGRLGVSGAALLDGQLELRLVAGFVPQPGDSFQVMTFASHLGSFASLVEPDPTGTVLLPRYSGTDLTIASARDPLPSRPAVTGGVLNFPVHTTAGFTYVVQRTPSLNPPNWQPLATFSGDGSDKPVTDSMAFPQGYYRVLVQ